MRVSFDGKSGMIDARWEHDRRSVGLYDKALARRVRQVRLSAGLTQAELAKRLGRSQTVVSLAESGGSRIGDRYVRAVMVACGVLAETEGSEAAPEQGYVVGLDPETGEVVRRGSERDEELREKYVWWSNGYLAG
jgi:transcriptional regulator with XRE-family HTH domain